MITLGNFFIFPSFSTPTVIFVTGCDNPKTCRKAKQALNISNAGSTA